MGFLDNAGLTRLWGKVTARRRTLTAAEYAALSEEEKTADVVYMVPETGGGASDGMTQEEADARYLQLSGGSMEGPLSVNTPTANSHAVSKGYVDSAVAGAGVPSGVIVMWSGAASAIPAGWSLCNGTNGTPDLRDKFVVGAGSTYSVGATGGEDTHTLTVAEIPPHNHSFHCSGGGASTAVRLNLNADARYDNERLGSFDTQLSGGGTAHNNLPPYYALCYIMKL